MTLSKLLKDKINIPSIESADAKFQELKEQFIEMGQLKSDFDIEKFTVRKEGTMVAHNFHFLMRQYVLAQYEMRRMLLEKEEKLRTIVDINAQTSDKVKVELPDGATVTKYKDLYLKQLENELDLLDVTVTNKVCMCLRFEEMRKKLIELNGGESPTNEQYQKEEPQYWKEFLTNRAKEQISERQTGVSAGIWESIRQLEEKSVINDSFKVQMLNDKGILDFDALRANQGLIE
jgi:hypothetical protein